MVAPHGLPQLSFGEAFKDIRMWQLHGGSVTKLASIVESRVPECACMLGISWGSVCAIGILQSLGREELPLVLLDPPPLHSSLVKAPISIPSMVLHHTILTFGGNNVNHTVIGAHPWETAVAMIDRRCVPSQNVSLLDHVRNLVRHIEQQTSFLTTWLPTVMELVGSPPSVKTPMYMTFSNGRTVYYGCDVDNITRYGQRILLVSVTGDTHNGHIHRLCTGESTDLVDTLYKLLE